MASPSQPGFLPLDFKQVIEIVRQLDVSDQRNLLLFLLGRQPETEEMIVTHFASEHSLSKDWLTDTEEEAWLDL